RNSNESTSKSSPNYQPCSKRKMEPSLLAMLAHVSEFNLEITFLIIETLFSLVNDGAAASVLASGKAVKQFGLKPLARIVGFADASVDPVDFPIAPAYAIPKILE